MNFGDESGAQRSGRVAFFSNLFERVVPSRTRTQRSSLIPRFLINPQVRIHILLQICHGKPFRFSWIFTGCFQIMLDPIFLSFLGYRKTYIYILFSQPAPVWRVYFVFRNFFWKLLMLIRVGCSQLQMCFRFCDPSAVVSTSAVTVGLVW